MKDIFAHSLFVIAALLALAAGISGCSQTAVPTAVPLAAIETPTAAEAPTATATNEPTATASPTDTPSPTPAPTETPVPTPEIATIDNLALAQEADPATVTLDNGIGLNDEGHIVSRFNYETKKWEAVEVNNYEEALMAISHPIPILDTNGNEINNNQFQFLVTSNVPATHPIHGWTVSEENLYPELADQTLPIGSEGDLVDRTILYAYKQIEAIARENWNKENPGNQIEDANIFPFFAIDINTNQPIDGPIFANMDTVKINLVVDMGGGTQLSLPTNLAENQNNQTGIGYLDLPFKTGTTGKEFKSGCFINPTTFKENPVIYFIMRTDNDDLNGLEQLTNTTLKEPMAILLYPQSIHEEMFEKPGKINSSDHMITYVPADQFEKYKELGRILIRHMKPIQDGRSWD